MVRLRRSTVHMAVWLLPPLLSAGLTAVGRGRLAWLSDPAPGPHNLVPAGSTFGSVPGDLADRRVGRREGWLAPSAGRRLACDGSELAPRQAAGRFPQR